MTQPAGLENVIYEVRDAVAFVTVSRPKALNALDDRTFVELDRVFESIREDDGVRAVVVTGAGEKAFVAGADIPELADMSPTQAQATSARGQRVFDAVEGCGKFVIAAVNGFALGGGLELALACHVRFAAEGARLGTPEVTLGLIPGYGATQRLPRLCGLGKALELLASGEMIDAQAALACGLVNRVLPADELLGAAEAFARKLIAKAGPVAVRYVLEAAIDGAGLPLADGLRKERDLFGLCFATADMKEGTGAFLEKRKAAFQGR